MRAVRALAGLAGLAVLGGCTVLTSPWDFEAGGGSADGGPRDALDRDANGADARVDARACAAVAWPLRCESPANSRCSRGGTSLGVDIAPWTGCEVGTASWFLLSEPGSECAAIVTVDDTTVGVFDSAYVFSSEINPPKVYGFSFYIEQGLEGLTQAPRVFFAAGIGVRIYPVDGTLRVTSENATPEPFGEFSIAESVWYDVIVEVDELAGTLHARERGQPFTRVGSADRGTDPGEVQWGLVRPGTATGVQRVRLTGFVHGDTFGDVACAL